jgi:hypothetical protein
MYQVEISFRHEKADGTPLPEALITWARTEISQSLAEWFKRCRLSTQEETYARDEDTILSSTVTVAQSLTNGSGYCDHVQDLLDLAQGIANALSQENVRFMSHNLDRWMDIRDFTAKQEPLTPELIKKWIAALNRACRCWPYTNDNDLKARWERLERKALAVLKENHIPLCRDMFEGINFYYLDVSRVDLPLDSPIRDCIVAGEAIDTDDLLAQV